MPNKIMLAPMTPEVTQNTQRTIGMKKEVSKRTGSSFLENIRNGSDEYQKQKINVFARIGEYEAKTTARLLVTIQTIRANFVCLIRNKTMAKKGLRQNKRL